MRRGGRKEDNGITVDVNLPPGTGQEDKNESQY
jgi:hypothetical protein